VIESEVDALAADPQPISAAVGRAKVGVDRHPRALNTIEPMSRLLIVTTPRASRSIVPMRQKGSALLYQQRPCMSSGWLACDICTLMARSYFPAAGARPPDGSKGHRRGCRRSTGSRRQSEPALRGDWRMLARAAMVSLEGSRLLAGQVLVHGELVDLRWTPCNACGGHPRSDAVCREPVEVLARLPEVNHAPTVVYRTGRAEVSIFGSVARRGGTLVVAPHRSVAGSGSGACYLVLLLRISQNSGSGVFGGSSGLTVGSNHLSC
jgi:hypothetical protein